jgi:hypothetical protein
MGLRMAMTYGLDKWFLCMGNHKGRDSLELVTLIHPSVSSVDSWDTYRRFAQSDYSWGKLVVENLEKGEDLPLLVRRGALTVLNREGLCGLLLLDQHGNPGWRWKVYWRTPRELMN